MNTAHWHLLFNHLPIIGTVIGTLILISGYLLKNNSAVKQTAMGVFVFSALTAIPAYLTGEAAEDLVEGLPGVTEQFIESHEDLSKMFLIVVLVLGTLSLATVISGYLKSKFASTLNVLVLITSIGTCILASQVGTSGGEIRHTEIRSEVTGQNTNATGQTRDIEKDDN